MSVRFAGLDSLVVPGLRLPVPKRLPRTASRAFQREWDKLDAIRKQKDLSPATVAAKCGFKRTAWFVYRNKGTIPFAVLEHVAEYLDAKVQLRVITDLSDAAATSLGEPSGEPMREFIEPLMELLEQVPEDRRQYAAGAIYAAAREAVRSLPFVGPSAEPKASRGRSK